LELEGVTAHREERISIEREK
jgi:hypothetical protein